MLAPSFSKVVKCRIFFSSSSLSVVVLFPRIVAIFLLKLNKYAVTFSNVISDCFFAVIPASSSALFIVVSSCMFAVFTVSTDSALSVELSALSPM